MVKGFWILIGDGWGTGLNMINPRLYTDNDGDNWFNYSTESEREMKIDLIASDIYCNYQIIE